MKVSMVIPTFNNPTLLRFLLHNLENSGNWPDELVVVSDYSPTQMMDEETVRQFESIYFERGKHLINFMRLSKWSGYSKTVNTGVRETAGGIVILVNTDVQFISHCLEKFKMEFEADPKLAVMGAKLFFPNGELQHAGAYHVWHKDFFNYGYKRREEDYPMAQMRYYAECMTGAVYAFRRGVYDELGGFDEAYKFWYEDPEFCYQAWEKGYKVLYNPDIQAIHSQGGSRGRVQDDRFKLTKVLSKKAWDDRVLTRPWNKIFRNVWKANLPLCPTGNESIMLERTGMLGDVIIFTALVHRVRKAYPDVNILVRTNFSDVFKGNPDVLLADPNLESPFPRLVTFNLSNEMHLKHPMAWAHWKVAIEAGLELGGYTKELPILYSSAADWESIKEKAGIRNGERYAVLHQAVTHWKSKLIPYHVWAQVSSELAGMGMKVLVIGYPQDQAPFGTAVDLRGDHSVQELRELIKHAALFVGVDSGPANIAQTTDTPAVVVFTCCDPKNIILSENIHAVVPTGCKFCLQRQPEPCGWVECPEGKNYECVKTVTAGAILEECLKHVNRINPHHIALSQEPEFIRLVQELVEKYQPTEIVETGTYMGTGSTVVFARTGLRVYSFECSEYRAKRAREYLREFPLVQVIHALSVDRERAIKHITEKRFLQDVNPEAYHDADPDKEVQFYLDEMKDECPDCGLFAYINKVIKQIILLDSAGGIGELELDQVFNLDPKVLKEKVLILDDADHVKHSASVGILQSMGYRVNFVAGGRVAWTDFSREHA